MSKAREGSSDNPKRIGGRIYDTDIEERFIERARRLREQHPEIRDDELDIAHLLQVDEQLRKEKERSG
jgi:hypothetical protein